MNKEEDAAASKSDGPSEQVDGSPEGARQEEQTSEIAKTRESDRTPVTQEPVQAKGCIVTVTRRPGCVVIYDARTSPELVQAARREAIRYVAKHVSLPGFRKGKAPIHLVAKRFPDEVMKETRKRLAQVTFEVCTQATGLLAATGSKLYFDVHSSSLEEGARLTLTFETRPEVPLVDLTGVSLSYRPEPAVSDKEIDATIDRLRHSHATWEDIVGRPPKDGEYVTLTVDVIEDDPPTNAFKEVRFLFDSKSMSKWMYDLVKDLRPNEHTEGLFFPEPDATEEEKQKYPPRRVRVLLIALQKIILPDLNDAFAQAVHLVSLDKLRASTREVLEISGRYLEVQEKHTVLSEYLSATYPIDLPQSYVQEMVTSHLRYLKSDPDTAKELNGITPEERKTLMRNIRKGCTSALRLLYLSMAVADKHNITVSPEDVTKRTSAILQQDPKYGAFSPQHRREGAHSRLLEERVLKFLVSQVTWVEKEPEDKEVEKPSAKEEEEASREQLPPDMKPSE